MDQRPPTLRVFVLHHEENVLSHVPSNPCFCPINLEELCLGTYQTNKLGEARAFLADYSAVEEDYVGFLNARFNQKYFTLSTRLETLPIVLPRILAPGWVITPWPAYDWLSLTAIHHPTMMALVEELLGLHGLPMKQDRVSVWANDFICHRTVFMDWHRFWRRSFDHFIERYGLDLPFDDHGTDPSRKTAFFLERITTAYFANRPDVRVVGLE